MTLKFKNTFVKNLQIKKNSTSFSTGLFMVIFICTLNLFSSVN